MARSSNRTTARSPQPNQSFRSLDSLLSFKPRLPPVLLPLPPQPLPVDVMPFVADRRRFHPDRGADASAVTRGAARLAIGRKFNSLRFADPAFVGICARRQARREVLFAKRKTRAGSRAPRRRNLWSSISC